MPQRCIRMDDATTRSVVRAARAARVSVGTYIVRAIERAIADRDFRPAPIPRGRPPAGRPK